MSRARGPRPPAAARDPDSAGVPPAARDPWAWLTLLAILPLVLRMAGAPWGEPVAEDFDFLRRALLEGMGTLADGGGSQAFWRPIPHQLYYAAFGRLILAAPAAVAVFHLCVLAGGALLVQRALRPSLGGPLSCLAATFPLLGESTRTLASWPTQFVDVGLWGASAVALHAAATGRKGRAMFALAVALLCKEVAVVLGVLLPLLPSAARDRRERVRFAGSCAWVLVLWGVATLLVRRAAGLELPSRIAQSPEALSASVWERFAWTLDASLRACWSLPRVPAADAAWAGGITLALVAVALVLLATRADARRRFVAHRAWLAWGVAWFTLGTLALTPIYPSWQPNRHQHASLGFGLASTVVLGSAHPALAMTNAAFRLVLLARAPGAVTRVEQEPPDAGAFMDWQRLTRLQHFMRAARTALKRELPTLPPGSVVVQQNLPHGVEYAFGGDHALQTWYGDRTLHWMRFDEFRAAPETPVAMILEGDPGHEPPVGLVRPDAMRALIRVQELAAQQRYAEIFEWLDRADSLQGTLASETYWKTSRELRRNAALAIEQSTR